MGGPGGAGGAVGEKARNSNAALKNLMGFCKPYIPAIVIALILGAANFIFFISHFPIPPPKAESGQFPDIRNADILKFISSMILFLRWITKQTKFCGQR